MIVGAPSRTLVLVLNSQLASEDLGSVLTVSELPQKIWNLKTTLMPSAPGEKDPQVAPRPATAPPLVPTFRPLNATGSPAVDPRLAQQSWPGHVVLLRPCAPWPPHVPVPLLLPQQNVVCSLTSPISTIFR